MGAAPDGWQAWVEEPRRRWGWPLVSVGALVLGVIIGAAGGDGAATAEAPSPAPSAMSSTVTVTAAGAAAVAAVSAEVTTSTITSTVTRTRPAKTVTRPARTVTVTKTSKAKRHAVAAPALDPRYRTCGDANDAGYGPYTEGVDPEYDWYQDRDGDGVDCEP
nr:excalibur calcium-binding domain-containing protein [Angustibacter aerolatus]